MFEVFFILTTIFVAYVVYSIMGEQKTTEKSTPIAVKPEIQPVVSEPAAPKPMVAEPVVAKQAKPQILVEKAQPAAIKTVAAVAPKVAPSKAAPSKAKVAATAKPPVAKKTTVATTKSPGLKNPSTGEIVTSYGNYRFTKRWIKDALVTEGLLEKVYPANELNAKLDANIKLALAKLEAMDKYKV
jgi:hypothetical protein